MVRNDAANYGSVRFIPGERRILTIDGKGAVLTVDVDTGRATPAYCCSSIWGDVELFDQGRQAVWAGHWPGIWDFPANRLVGRLTAQREFMTFGPIAIDAAEEQVFLGSQDGHVYRWSLKTRELLSKSSPLPDYVMTVSVLGTSGWIAYASRPGVVRLWNPRAGAHRIVPAARASSNIAFDQRRGLSAFGTELGTIEYWDLPNGRLVDTKAFSHSR
jgi:WD40 repeat protein